MSSNIGRLDSPRVGSMNAPNLTLHLHESLPSQKLGKQRIQACPGQIGCQIGRQRGQRRWSKGQCHRLGPRRRMSHEIRWRQGLGKELLMKPLQRQEARRSWRRRRSQCAHTLARVTSLRHHVQCRSRWHLMNQEAVVVFKARQPILLTGRPQQRWILQARCVLRRAQSLGSQFAFDGRASSSTSRTAILQGMERLVGKPGCTASASAHARAGSTRWQRHASRNGAILAKASSSRSWDDAGNEALALTICASTPQQPSSRTKATTTHPSCDHGTGAKRGPFPAIGGHPCRRACGSCHTCSTHPARSTCRRWPGCNHPINASPLEANVSIRPAAHACHPSAHATSCHRCRCATDRRNSGNPVH